MWQTGLRATSTSSRTHDRTFRKRDMQGKKSGPFSPSGSIAAVVHYELLRATPAKHLLNQRVAPQAAGMRVLHDRNDAEALADAQYRHTQSEEGVARRDRCLLMSRKAGDTEGKLTASERPSAPQILHGAESGAGGAQPNKSDHPTAKPPAHQPLQAATQEVM